MFGLRLSGGSGGLSLRLRFKVGVEVEVEIEGIKVCTCPIDESIVLGHCRRFLAEIRSSRRSDALTVKLMRGFEL